MRPICARSGGDNHCSVKVWRRLQQMKDRKFARPEAAGIQLALDGIAGDDATALDRAMVVFDALYAALSAGAARVGS
jgi:hypothetical protein